MSKLTPEQKVANKAAQKVRDRAYTARSRDFRIAREAAEKAAEESIFADRRDQADAAMDQELRNRNEALDTIKREIERLNEKMELTRAQYALSIETKKQARNDTQFAFQAHRDALLKDVDTAFPDMKSCWYVSQWEVPADVKAQMDAAAASVKEAA